MIVEFLLLWALNVTVIAFLIWRRSIFSAEGYALSYLALAVVVDGVHLLILYVVAPESLLTDREFSLRVYPTVVHVIGLIVFGFGLHLADPRSTPVPRSFADDSPVVVRTAMCLIGIGMALHTVAIFISGASISVDYPQQIDVLRQQSTAYGGFWSRGVVVAMFGVALLVGQPRAGGRTVLAVLLVEVMLATFLIGGKGPTGSAIIFVGFLAGVYNRSLFWQLMRPSRLAILLMLIFLGTGFKSIVATRGFTDIPSSLAEISESSMNAIEARYSASGLYRRYASLVEYLTLQDPNYFVDFRVGLFSLTSWVPRLLYPDKPDHPYRGIDFMMNPERITEFPEGNEAPLLVGWAFSDAGLWSLIPYLLVGGAVVGSLRRFAASSHRGLQWHLTYIFFTLTGGVSPEVGLLGFMDTAIFALVVMMAAHAVATWLWVSVELE